MANKPTDEFAGDEQVLFPNVSRTAPVIGANPTNTFLSRAIADEAAEAQGRFGAIRQPATIVGTSPGASMPGASPGWSRDLNLPGDEPSLGYSVDGVGAAPSPAEVLRQQADALSKSLSGLDVFWQNRLAKLVDTMLAFADQIDGGQRP
jgi:hypothetical protein